MSTLLLAFLAGILSILSPCVLPLVPLALGSAAAKGRFGPVWLALGLATSFVVLGLFIALMGFSLGLDQGFFRLIAAFMLIVVGTILSIPALQARFASAAGPVSGWVNDRVGHGSTGGAFGQFGMGLLLGAVWSPCVGPTLGAASLLAAQGKNLAHVTLTMLAFGLGAAIPMLLLGLASREVMMKWRGRMMRGGQGVKIALGLVLVATGLLIVSGFDKQLETILVEASPDWLTRLTTRF